METNRSFLLAAVVRVSPTLQSSGDCRLCRIPPKILSISFSKKYPYVGIPMSVVGSPLSLVGSRYSMCVPLRDRLSLHIPDICILLVVCRVPLWCVWEWARVSVAADIVSRLPYAPWLGCGALVLSLANAAAKPVYRTLVRIQSEVGSSIWCVRLSKGRFWFCLFLFPTLPIPFSVLLANTSCVRGRLCFSRRGRRNSRALSAILVLPIPHSLGLCLFLRCLRAGQLSVCLRCCSERVVFYILERSKGLRIEVLLFYLWDRVDIGRRFRKFWWIFSHIPCSLRPELPTLPALRLGVVFLLHISAAPPLAAPRVVYANPRRMRHPIVVGGVVLVLWSTEWILHGLWGLRVGGTTICLCPSLGPSWFSKPRRRWSRGVGGCLDLGPRDVVGLAFCSRRVSYDILHLWCSIGVALSLHLRRPPIEYRLERLVPLETQSRPQPTPRLCSMLGRRLRLPWWVGPGLQILCAWLYARTKQRRSPLGACLQEQDTDREEGIGSPTVWMVVGPRIAVLLSPPPGETRSKASCTTSVAASVERSAPRHA